MKPSTTKKFCRNLLLWLLYWVVVTGINYKWWHFCSINKLFYQGNLLGYMYKKGNSIIPNPREYKEEVSNFGFWTRCILFYNSTWIPDFWTSLDISDIPSDSGLMLNNPQKCQSKIMAQILYSPHTKKI